MRAALLLSLAFSAAVSGCDIGNPQHDIYEQQNQVMDILIYKPVGSSGTVKHDNVVDVIYKTGEYTQFKTVGDNGEPGNNYCDRFNIITGEMTPQGYFIIPYHKTDKVIGTELWGAYTTKIVIAKLNPEALLSIPDRIPGTPGLKKPYKIARKREMNRCFFRPDNFVVQ